MTGNKSKEKWVLYKKSYLQEVADFWGNSYTSFKRDYFTEEFSKAKMWNGNTFCSALKRRFAAVKMK